MNVFIIILTVAAIVALVLYLSTKNAHEIKEHEKPIIKFEPRKVVDFSKGQLGIDPVPAPKKKYYKKRKKKPSINVSIDKKPVGRPRKTTE
tara:strand:+ start:433 stop:705 length:273 start_codon:yes stop_codon:yes gene_type:complete